MITETEYVWHKTESIDFKTMPVSEIIDEVILAWPYYEYAFYYYYDLTPPKKVSDPLNKFSGYTVEFDTAGIHRILKNVFGREPDYKDGEYHYYHNNKLYVRDRLGIGDYGYRLDSTKLVNKTYLGNGKYTITVASKFYEKGSNNKEELCSYNYKFTVKPIKGTDGKYTWLMESYENLSK